MLLKRNLLENLTILSSGGTIVCVLLNYVTNISLITGVWFHLYILLIFIVSVLLSFKCIQWLLRLNKPLKYDAETLVKEYPYLAVLTRFLPEPKKRVPYVWKEYDTNELSVISTVLERKLVSSWYVPYVSQEIGFPFACKQMLDQMIAKAFKICNKIETKDVFIDMCTILITHFKEYKKAMKRQEKSPENSIESLYKTSHPISEPNTKYTTADHCTNILRIVIKDLLPWELWDTPHSELLVRILSKKLDSFIENTLADPIWINNKLMTYLTGKEYEESVETEKLDDDKKDAIPEKIITPVVKTEVKEEVNVKPQEDVMKLANIVEEQAVDITPSLDVKSSPVLRQRRGRQGRNEVKIYDRIIEGSVKTWETDMDLQCISLGQDLLASLDGEITLSRLWGQDTEPEGSPERPGGKSPQPLWFGEEDTISPEAAERASPRPAVLSELQHTVSHAKTRIGDLQVCEAPHADEAAGMMEGLLDFGIAGLKKGLRFTGLSDDSQIQDDTADLHGVSQPVVSNICKRVAGALAKISHRYLTMPSTLQQQQANMRKFRTLADFPTVIGAIDCTHIRVKKINADGGQMFINRKGFPSINVQVVCNADLKIMDIVTRWRGSVHDSRIFRECRLKQRFEAGLFSGVLLGDSGYPCTPYLLTPLLNPTTPQEVRYNNSHCRTRNTIERCFGLWKQRFRCLLRGMYCSIETCKKTIVACAVLHNIAIDMKEGIFPDGDVTNEISSGSAISGRTVQNNVVNTVRGNIRRRQFIDTHF